MAQVALQVCLVSSITLPLLVAFSWYLRFFTHAVTSEQATNRRKSSVRRASAAAHVGGAVEGEQGGLSGGDGWDGEPPTTPVGKGEGKDEKRRGTWLSSMLRDGAKSAAEADDERDQELAAILTEVRVRVRPRARRRPHKEVRVRVRPRACRRPHREVRVRVRPRARRRPHRGQS